MSHYNKASGAKRRAEQKEKETKDKLLLAKVPKLTTIFKYVSSTSSPSTSVPSPQPPTEQSEDREISVPSVQPPTEQSEDREISETMGSATNLAYII